MEVLSEIYVSYFEGELENFNHIVYKLSNCDITKAEQIENMEVNKVYEWYYITKVKELNEMRKNIAEIKKMRDR